MVERRGEEEEEGGWYKQEGGGRGEERHDPAPWMHRCVFLIYFLYFFASQNHIYVTEAWRENIPPLVCNSGRGEEEEQPGRTAVKPALWHPPPQPPHHQYPFIKTHHCQWGSVSQAWRTMAGWKIGAKPFIMQDIRLHKYCIYMAWVWHWFQIRYITVFYTWFFKPVNWKRLHFCRYLVRNSSDCVWWIDAPVLPVTHTSFTHMACCVCVWVRERAWWCRNCWLSWGLTMRQIRYWKPCWSLTHLELFHVGTRGGRDAVAWGNHALWHASSHSFS